MQPRTRHFSPRGESGGADADGLEDAAGAQLLHGAAVVELRGEGEITPY